MKPDRVHLCVVGVNHSTTPIDLREKLAIGASQLGETLVSLHSYVPQGIILSTCNRTEVYTVAGDGRCAQQAGLDFLEAHTNMPQGGLSPHVYVYQDTEAMEHLFGVASGLDSMIIGEFEILGQVKQAVEEAERSGLVGLPLLRLFREAVRVGRRVREETGISRNALSVSSVAVDLARRVVGDLSQSRILVIGAGEAGRLVAKAARERGAYHMVVTSRSREKASTLAETLGGRAVALSSLEDELKVADLVISCTGAPHTILDSPRLRRTMQVRPELPLVVIDIAVPRDVEPEVGQVDNVFLYNIDHLIEVSNSNRGLREREIQRAVALVRAEVDSFASWWRALGVRHTVSALVRKAEHIRRAQLAMTLNKLHGLSAEEQDSLEAMTRAMVKKLLHEPIQRLKENQGYAQVVSELFGLDEEEPR